MEEKKSWKFLEFYFFAGLVVFGFIMVYFFAGFEKEVDLAKNENLASRESLSKGAVQDWEGEGRSFFSAISRLEESDEDSVPSELAKAVITEMKDGDESEKIGMVEVVDKGGGGRFLAPGVSDQDVAGVFDVVGVLDMLEVILRGRK